MPLREVCGGRVSVFLGPFPNPFSRLLSDESDKGALFAAQNLFLVLSVVGCQGSVVTVLSGHSIENQMPRPVTRIAVNAKISVFMQRTTDDVPRTPTFGSELPFPLSSEILWK